MVSTDIIFYWGDVGLSLVIYAISIVLFIRHIRGYIIGILIFGLFVFPLQFSIWFLPSKPVQVSITTLNLFEVLYLILLKVAVLITLLLYER